MNLYSKILLIGSLTLLIGTKGAFACSCIQPGSPEEELKKSASVFIGKVKSISEQKKTASTSQAEQINSQLKVTFDVSKGLKSTKSSTVEVYTANNSAMCGVHFEQEKEYIVYTYQDEKNNKHASLCSRTNALENAKEDIQALTKKTYKNKKEFEKAEGQTCDSVTDGCNNYVIKDGKVFAGTLMYCEDIYGKNGQEKWSCIDSKITSKVNFIKKYGKSCETATDGVNKFFGENFELSTRIGYPKDFVADWKCLKKKKSQDSNTSPATCKEIYSPVCGQPPMPTCPKGHMCAQVMPKPKTYSNDCVMRSEKATKIHAGKCKNQDNIAASSLVHWAHDAKITRYNNLSDFGFDREISRQEAAAFIVRGIGEHYQKKSKKDLAYKCQHSFVDNNNIDTSLAGDVQASCGMGLFKGHDGRFNPKFSLTRGEALGVLMRSTDHYFVESMSNPWYLEHAQYAKDVDILSMEEIDTKNLDRNITRGELIKWIRKTIDYLYKKMPIADPIDTNLIGKWTLQQVSTLSNKENAKIKKGGGTLTFLGDGIVSFSACNAGSGEFAISHGKIIIKNMIGTQRFCEDIKGTIESHITFGEGEYTISGNTLTIKESDKVLTFKRSTF